MKFYLVSASIKTTGGIGFAQETFATDCLPSNQDEFDELHSKLAVRFSVEQKDMVIISITELNEFQE